MRTRVDENRSAIDDRVAIIANTVFWRNVVVGYPIAGQVCADPYVTVVRVRWNMPLDDVAVKTRPLVDSEYAVHTADNAADGTTDNSTNRACCPFTFAGSAFDTAGHTLSGCDRGNNQRRC